MKVAIFPPQLPPLYSDASSIADAVPSAPNSDDTSRITIRMLLDDMQEISKKNDALAHYISQVLSGAKSPDEQQCTLSYLAKLYSQLVCTNEVLTQICDVLA